MKPTVIAILLALPYYCFSQYTYQNLHVNYLTDATSAKNYTYGNLRLYPVYAKQSFKSKFNNMGNYMSLQEALSKKKVKIIEKPNGGSVEKLTIENISNDTIIVICGDVIKGGQQDRIVEKDMVLNPKSGKKDLHVFCVEAGRWSSGAQSLSTRTSGRSGNVQAPLKGAQFNTHYNKGSMGLRKVVEKEKDQSKVWSKVEEMNTKNNTTNTTKTYTAMSNSADYNKKINAYVQYFSRQFAAEKDVIGVVVVSGKKVLGCDLFATSSLFNNQFPSLLHSYATEAIVNGLPVTISPQVVKAYTDQLLKDEATQQKTLKQKGNSFTTNGKKLRVSSFD